MQSTNRFRPDFVGFTSSETECLFLHTYLHVYCAPELVNSLPATSLPATKYEPKYCKALKVTTFGVVFFI